MKNEKQKLNAEQIVEFFTSKPIFDKTETAQYGWPTTTHDGLYTITDIYKYFEAKGFENKDVDDCIYKCFQKQDAFVSKLQKMEKGKTHNMFFYYVYNHNPDYKSHFVYYFYDLTKEEVLNLKKEYEEASLANVQNLIAKRKNSTKNQSVAKKAKVEKKAKVDKTEKADKPKTERRTRIKKPALIEA